MMAEGEGKWVALSIAVILLVAAILIPYHQASTRQLALASHQIAIQELEPQELAMIAIYVWLMKKFVIFAG